MEAYLFKFMNANLINVNGPFPCSIQDLYKKKYDINIV